MHHYRQKMSHCDDLLEVSCVTFWETLEATELFLFQTHWHHRCKEKKHTQLMSSQHTQMLWEVSPNLENYYYAPGPGNKISMNSSTWELWIKVNNSNVTFLGISQKEMVSSLDQNSMGKFFDPKISLTGNMTVGTQMLHGSSKIDVLSLVSGAYSEILAGISSKFLFKVLKTLRKLLNK